MPGIMYSVPSFNNTLFSLLNSGANLISMSCNAGRIAVAFL